MSFFVYILYSPGHDRYYKGHTKDLAKRLSRHNAGKERSTAPYRPWQLVWFAIKPTRGAAMALETKLKMLSRVRTRAFITKYKK
jgi:putative endonuclease